jgi:hypothetical protein
MSSGAFGSYCSVIKVLPWNFLGRHEKKTHKKKLSGQSRFELGALPEYKSSVLSFAR